MKIKPAKIFNYILTILLISFIAIFISNKYGYYEYKKHKQVMLTQEQITRFENDIKSGKDISLEDYAGTVKKNYQTKLSKAGLSISNKLSSLVKTGVNNIFKSIDKLINEK